MKCTAEQGIKTLVGKIIQFTDKVEEHEIDFDCGMLARIKGIRKDQPNDPSWKVYILQMDFSEFEEHNRGYMKPNYYDKNGVACETWEQQNEYNNSLKNGCRVYLQFEEDKNNELCELPFELAPNQLVPPTLTESLNALERVTMALKARNLGKPYACLDEVFAEANYVLKRAKRDEI